MPGGLIQLVGNSNADNFLTQNPQISFFKSVFRKYSRFALESIDEPVTNSDLSKFDTNKISIKIPRNGDLLCGIYVVFNLPPIFSGKSTDNANTFNFKWVRKVAAQLLKEVTLFIGNQKIDTLTSEWLSVQSELHLSDEQKSLLSKLSGEIKELYEPESATGNNSTYPHIKGNGGTFTQHDRHAGNVMTFAQANTSSTFPSIDGKKLKIPLPFFFSESSGNALPLIALQYSEVRLDITLAPLYDLFTVLDTRNALDSTNKRVKVTSATDNSLGFANFSDALQNNKLPINMSLECVYAFLDTEERKRFAAFPHQYLITQMKNSRSVKGADNSTELNYYLSGINPVKYIVVVPKRNDSKNMNLWTNFINWQTKYPIYSEEFSTSEQYYDNVLGRYPFYTTSYGTQTDLSVANSKKSIIESMVLKFNGQERFKERTKEYFELQQPLQHFEAAPSLDGIFVYSFSLNADNIQPSGSCDFTVYNEIQVAITANIPNISDYTYSIDLDIYTINYNILNIQNGIGALVFAS